MAEVDFWGRRSIFDGGSRLLLQRSTFEAEVDF